MPLREYVCGNCKSKEEKLFKGDYPKIIIWGCSSCQGNLIYTIGLTGYRRDKTIHE
jgi:hypothetical protein